VNAALVRFEDGLQFALAAVPPGGVVPKFIDPRLAAGDGIYGLGWRSPERKGESGIVTVLAPLGGDPPLAPAVQRQKKLSPGCASGQPYCAQSAMAGSG
jgi:hypothetical protein